MKIKTPKLKRYLIESEIISEEKFSEVSLKAEEDGKEIEHVLVEENYITEEDLTTLKANIAGIPFINLETQQIPLEFLKIIPEHIARLNSVVSYRKSGNELEVAMIDPTDLCAIDLIKKTTEMEVLPRLTTVSSIKSVIQQYQDSLEVEFEEIFKGDKEKIKEISGLKGKEKDNLKKAAKEVSIVKIVDTLIKHAIFQKASDIHIEPEEKEITVRYRVDGILRDAMILPMEVASAITARIKILADLKLDEHRLPQDGRFRIEINNYKHSLRVSVLPVLHGEKIVMRLLSDSEKTMDLEKIGITGNSLSEVKKCLKKKSGMVLVTGPTGSGKTTTLYSLLQILNTTNINISTIEDPIEYEIPRVNQTQVNEKVGLTFASGLRSLVRQDPDIIMVGEVRDNETAHLATNASLTGHLVLSTLHTTDAAGAISRLIDMGIEPFLISSTLDIVIGQRLLRKLSDEKEGYYLTDEGLNELKKFTDIERLANILIEKGIIKKGQKVKDVEFFRPKNSSNVSNRYKGRIGIYEVLAVDETIKDMIIKRTGSSKIKEHARKEEGMITMLEDGLIKAAQGITSIEEVLRVIIE